MRKLLVKLKESRTMAKMALLQSQETLRKVKERDAQVEEITNKMRLLRQENHFRQTVKEALKW